MSEWEDTVYAKSRPENPPPQHAGADGVPLSFCQQDRGIRVKHGRTEEAAMGSESGREWGETGERASRKL